MTSQRPLASALDRVFPHLLILLYSLGAAVIYDHHWPFRGHGDSPILDLVDFHHPAFYKALEIWHYLAPVVAAYLAALVLPSALTLIARWRSPWKTFLRLPWNIFLRLLNLIQISTQHTALLLFAFTVAWLHYYYRPFTQHSEDPLLVLIAVHDPGFYTAITVWYYLAPGVAVLLAGMLLLSVYRVWIATDGPQAERGALPSWLDSYSLAYTISSLLNPLFGKGKEPFWQQAGLHRRLEAKTLNQPVPVVESAKFFQTPNQFWYRLPTNTDHCLSFCILTGMLTHAGGTEAGTMVGFAGSI